MIDCECNKRRDIHVHPQVHTCAVSIHTLWLYAGYTRGSGTLDCITALICSLCYICTIVIKVYRLPFSTFFDSSDYLMSITIPLPSLCGTIPFLGGNNIVPLYWCPFHTPLHPFTDNVIVEVQESVSAHEKHERPPNFSVSPILTKASVILQSTNYRSIIPQSSCW